MTVFKLTGTLCLFAGLSHILSTTCSQQDKQTQALYSKVPSGGATAANNHVADGAGSPEEVEVLLSKQKVSRQPSFLRSLLRAFGPYFLIGSAYKLLQDLITFVNPQLLR